jgi:hypothetical protein
MWDQPAGRRRAVRKHLEFCNRCYPQYDIQRAYFEYTHHVRDEERAPAELRRRLFQTLLEREAMEEEAR